jgi:hypothetical protein
MENNWMPIEFSPEFVDESYNVDLLDEVKQETKEEDIG